MGVTPYYKGLTAIFGLYMIIQVVPWGTIQLLSQKLDSGKLFRLLNQNTIVTLLFFL